MLQTLKILREQFDRKVIIGTQQSAALKRSGIMLPVSLKRNYLFLFL
jgi:hypothetical protein